ncbi:hypothetical protein RIR_e6773_jg11801.t1 [Rhizophagus irregularis DAOM 181602=DAOM 197198]|nr:hypothetical protein RIR_e6773_jg11801.t1 [Rhizophagus irregularis DAOM 181602=DAOM 197198]
MQKKVNNVLIPIFGKYVVNDAANHSSRSQFYSINIIPSTYLLKNKFLSLTQLFQHKI